jgi:hypothetical protein
MNYIEEFFCANPELKLNKFLKKENIQLTESKLGPGLYIIFCERQNKIYLGQSENICRRLGDHRHTLNKNYHDCVELQNDWNRFGSKYKDIFYASISETSINLNMSETSIRRKLKDLNQKEFEYINSSELEPQLVNIEKAKPVYVNGVYYRSERYASEKTGIIRRTLRRHLQSNNHDYCYYA